ncbi:hypothetical protein E8L99_20475 [Phreatobacter aquaticus]|uniref:DUF3617 family protein n=1 Tax=Phreatobacter aquaticus TaxID=2570229 RepID=A0A4D7QR28_9HYPH|nr:DUF3617 family protein [Phreatobacter aquaticus]QCK87959.1 hypothetical protein E8L99_20475 [Phreatobacter aquaticus]
MRLFALAVAVLGATPAFAQVELPQRRAGQWEITMTTGEGSAATEFKTTACTDAGAERAMMAMGTGMMGQMCQRNDIRRDGQGYLMESDCQMGPMRVVSTTRITGDFQSAYQMRIEGQVTGTPGAAQQKTVTIQSARFVSATCTGGLVPGDMLLPGGQKMNVLNMPGLGGAGAPAGGANRRQP